MIEKIIECSIRNRFLVLVAAAALAAFAVYAVLDTPMDATPDLSENQVIVFTDWMGRSPREIEDQITYPLSLKLQGLAGVRAVRSSSEFNFSMITLIFEDKLDFYFTRQRVLERLTLASTFLPEGVAPYLAADATAVGQVFWYTVEGGTMEPGRRWALQKYYIGPEINSVPGVAEVGTVGGSPLEYQIDVNPNALRAYNVTLGELYEAVSRSNSAVGGSVVQKNNAEYLIRGVGWLGSRKETEANASETVESRVLRDLEDTVLTARDGVPIAIKNVARVQVGVQFRRSVFIKGGSEMVGAVVVMRYGENPLAVTNRVKQKIQELQPGLPSGVHIVPAYDRTRLIHGAIQNVAEVMGHEMLIAAVAILLILMHVRSVFVICITLPLSVLFSFLMLWVLRALRVVDVQANIMSLAGITISIGILVDQAIVMVENATHDLKEHFGDSPVTGDTTEIIVRACRTVGRPIFFSVLIILISFIPVFAMSGREGKYFHPMAFTKSLAMVGVAFLSVTVVPALLPTFLRGRLRSEEQNPIVRSFIRIYKPMLTWALPRRNLVAWMFAVLLILAVGMFPLQAVLGIGASHRDWEMCFFVVLAAVIFLTVVFTRGGAWQVVSFATLVLVGLIAYRFPKIGVEFMPPLNEQTVMDMPVTVPRASITEAADDLKVRDALLRQFPEVESAINKAGRADTPTDPAPLEMVETFVNFRPRELWPRRVLAFDEAARQVRLALGFLEERGSIPRADAEERDALVNDATMAALTKFDEAMRELALRRYREMETELGPALTRFVVEDSLRRFRAAGLLQWPNDADEGAVTEKLVEELAPRYGIWLSKNPALEDVAKLTQSLAQRLRERGVLTTTAADALKLRQSMPRRILDAIAESLGSQGKTFAGEVFAALQKRRHELWIERIHKRINWELFDRGVETFTWAAVEELGRAAKIGRDLRDEFASLREQLEKPFAKGLILWQRKGGTKGDLLQEMDGVVQMPGWSNIWTQPIINRVDMLSTGVRTQIGVKVFGPDLDTINRVCKEVEQAIKPVPGAMDVIAEPFMGKGYVEIHIDRRKAARFGVRVGDIQDTIEVALGGKLITQTVEGRDRFPVRVRYARDFREDEQAVKALLVTRGNMGSLGRAMSAGPTASRAEPARGSDQEHQAAPWHSADGKISLQIPLEQVADVHIVEGPATIKSENGRLRSYVTLNVRGDRDVVGFVEEAQRVVAEKVDLPEGVHLEWSGEFEHQVRAAKTLRIILPMVLILIFLILYLTYKDFADACLMMLAVPEALAGGVFFQFLFPKIVHGWSSPPEPFSMGIWVGYIAAFGMATETGIIMLVYLREAIDKRGGLENIQSLEELRQTVIEGAVHRLRPKLLTEGVAIVAIAPMLFSTGIGGEIISAMALPVLGGLLIADEVVDLFLPVRFYWVRRARWLKIHEKRVAQERLEKAVALLS